LQQLSLEKDPPGGGGVDLSYYSTGRQARIDFCTLVFLEVRLNSSVFRATIYP